MKALILLCINFIICFFCNQEVQSRYLLISVLIFADRAANIISGSSKDVPNSVVGSKIKLVSRKAKRMVCGETHDQNCRNEFENAKRNNDLEFFYKICRTEGGANPMRKTCSLCCNQVTSRKYNLQCFGPFPLLVKSKQWKYGDICRRSNYPADRNWRCPKNCVKTSNNKKPFCQRSRFNKKPCHVAKDLSALPTKCRKKIQWAFEKGRKQPAAEKWYGDMKNVIGVGYKKANIYDFVRFFKCNGRNAKICSGTRLIPGIFWPKDRCSNPPCNKCLGETTPPPPSFQCADVNADTNPEPIPWLMVKLDESFDIFRDKLNKAFQKIHGFHLYEGNQFGSLFSPLLAIGMLLLGSSGDTDSQIRENAFAGWQFNDQNLDEPHLAMLDLIKAVTKPYMKSNDVMRFNNRMYIQKRFGIVPKYLTATDNCYNQEREKIDFSKPQIARATINNWVRETTGDKLPDLLPENSLSSDTKLVIVNAVYFHGFWKQAFNPSLTAKRDFSILKDNRSETVMVDMMSKEGTFEFYKPDDAEVLKLNFGEDRMSMFIILPDSEFGLLQSFKYFDYKSYEDTKQYLQAKIIIPKFEIQANYNFSETIPEAGIKDLFDERKADLSGISTVDQLFLNEMHQQAYIRVDEEGTEATIAVGSVDDTRGFRAGTKEFLCDHPFLFTIVENTFGNCLFQGLVANPSLGPNDEETKTTTTAATRVCVFEGIEYTGQPYKGMNPYRVNSFQECYDDFVAKNKADDTCRAFTFRGSNGGGDCLLKHWKGNENQSDGATSGTIINCN